MAILAIHFTEEGRSKCCLVLAILNWMCILLSICILGIGLYIKFAVAEFTNLVDNYDGQSLPYLLLSVGGLSAAINLGGGILIFFSGTPSKREEIRNYLFAYVVLSLLIDICILVGGIFCFAHIQHLDASFKQGILRAMAQYKDAPEIKLEIDLLQMSYKCCGNDKYTDWFHVSWIKNEYLNLQAAGVTNKLQNGKLVNDDTPFSCCNPESPRPCIHHNVHDNSQHYNYDYRNGVTLYPKGCREVLMNYLGDWLLINTGAVIIAIFVLETGLVIAARYLQSSISNALDAGDPEAPAPGWIAGGAEKPAAPQEEEKEAAPLLNDQDPQLDETFGDFDNTLVQQPSGSIVQNPSGALYGLARDPTYENLPRRSQVGIVQSQTGRSSRASRASLRALSQRGSQLSQAAIQQPLDGTFNDLDNTVVQQPYSYVVSQQPTGGLYELEGDPNFQNLPRRSQVGMVQSQTGQSGRMSRASSQALLQQGNQYSLGEQPGVSQAQASPHAMPFRTGSPRRGSAVQPNFA